MCVFVCLVSSQRRRTSEDTCAISTTRDVSCSCVKLRRIIRVYASRRRTTTTHDAKCSCMYICTYMAHNSTIAQGTTIYGVRVVCVPQCRVVFFLSAIRKQNTIPSTPKRSHLYCVLRIVFLGSRLLGQWRRLVYVVCAHGGVVCVRCVHNTRAC